MTFEELKYHLPTFLLFFALCMFYWRRLRARKIMIRIDNDGGLIKDLSKINRLFTILYIAVCFVIILYAFFNNFYNQIMFPFERLDTKPINNFGVMVLNISFIWVIVTQMNIDLIIFRIASGKMDGSAIQQIFIYSEKSILIGFLIMLIGIFITISSVVSMVLAIIGIIIYYIIFIKKINKNVPVRK